MSALTCWKFDGAGTAALAAAAMPAPGAGGAHVLGTAAIAWPTTARGPTLDPEGADGHRLDESFWTFFSGLVFGVPMIGAATGSPRGAVTSGLDSIGIDETFMNKARDMLTPGSSMLFVLASWDGNLAITQSLYARGPLAVVHEVTTAGNDELLCETFAG